MQPCRKYALNSRSPERDSESDQTLSEYTNYSLEGVLLYQPVLIGLPIVLGVTKEIRSHRPIREKWKPFWVVIKYFGRIATLEKGDLTDRS